MLWKFVCLFVVVVSASLDASPVPQNELNSLDLTGQIFDKDDTFFNTPARNGRQNYFYDYPYSYPSYDFYKSPAYPDYYNSFYDTSNYAPQSNRRPHINGYPSKKKSQRRKGFPFEPTTQKYTIWDLARK